MSARAIFQSASLGSLVRYSDGRPRPPDRFARKLAAWQNTNGSGMLIRKTPARDLGRVTIPDAFTLHVGSYGSEGVVVLVVQRIYDVTSPLAFSVESSPRPGQVLVVAGSNAQPELKYLAADLGEAEAWASLKGYRDLRLVLVGEDDVPVPAGPASDLDVFEPSPAS